VRRAAMIGVSLLSLFQIMTLAQGPKGEAVEHSVMVDGISRKYLVFAPKGFDKPLPVVLALHGGGSNARPMERYTRFNDLAAKEGFLVVSHSDTTGLKETRPDRFLPAAPRSD